MKNIDAVLHKFRRQGKINVLFCINSLSGGGAEKVLMDILRHFDYERYCVDLLLFYSHGTHGVYLDDVPDEVLILSLEDEEYLSQAKYDVEIAFLEGLATEYIARKESAARKIAWVHNDWYHHWPKISYNDSKVIEVYSRMNLFVFVSEGANRGFSKLFPKMEVPKIVIHNLIDVADIRSRSNAFSVEKRKLTLCCASRLVEVKGYTRLISVVDRLVYEDGLDFDLWILGDGEQRDAMAAKIKQHSLEDVIFLKGFQKNPHPYIKTADLFVLPSFSESFPLVLAEAMCLGKPTLTTELPGPQEMLDYGIYGLLVENNEEGIYMGLKQMIGDEELREKYARKARFRAEMFNTDRAMTQIYDLLPTPNMRAEMSFNERVLNYVILASASSRNQGLLDGKMGVILFLMNHAKSAANEIYREMAEGMLDEIWTDINESTSIGLASGLCGIGWGIEYLIQNGFADGDANEICEEVDRAVRLQKMHPGMDLSLDMGLEGILHYVMARIVGNLSREGRIPFDNLFLEELYGMTKRKQTGIFLVFNRFYGGSSCEYRLDTVDLIPIRISIKKNLSENQLGLRGMTGHLFKEFL